MIRILIHKGDVKTINYLDKKTGEPKTLRAQEAYAFTLNAEGQPAPFPEKFEFLLERDQRAFPPGEYQLHPSALYVDRNHKLGLSVRLAPLTSPAKA